MDFHRSSVQVVGAQQQQRENALQKNQVPKLLAQLTHVVNDGKHMCYCCNVQVGYDDAGHEVR